MAATKYSYSIADDFPATGFNSDRMVEDIEESAIVTALDRIASSGDNVDIWFVDALSAGDKTILDGDTSNPAGGLIAAHTGAPLPGLKKLTTNLCFASNDDPWIKHGDAAAEVKAQFIFEGTKALGVPKVIYALVEQDTGVTGRITIYDYDNSKQIAQVSDSSSTPTIKDLGTLSNLPTEKAIWEIHLERTAGTGTNKTKIGALYIGT
jgi:hypothetical protein